MKVLVFLAVWKRPEITEICFVGLNRLIKNSRYPIEAFAVISEESMIPLCDKYNIKWTFYKNEPVGEKKNHGLNEAMKLEWDYLLEIGSDDLVKDELIELYAPNFGKYDLFGTKDAIIINSEDGMCRRLNSDTTYGLGRCMSRKAVECAYGVDILALEHIIAIGRTTAEGERGFFKVEMAEEQEKLGRIKILGKPRYRLWKDDINRGLDNNSDFFFMKNGIGHRAIKTDKPLCIDIKGEDNIWKFSPKLGTPYDLEKALEGLSQEEQSRIVALWKREHNKPIEYADNI
jgi:hypothetical protein